MYKRQSNLRPHTWEYRHTHMLLSGTFESASMKSCSQIQERARILYQPIFCEKQAFSMKLPLLSTILLLCLPLWQLLLHDSLYKITCATNLIVQL